MTGTPEEKQEIIIVRRSGGDGDGGHHGGAWKIAYADFVTAMMAFFLVMWLINSANEVTKSRVASYFNPIKMTDASPSGRGVKDAVERKAIESPKQKDSELKTVDEVPNTVGGDVTAEVEIMQNPYVAIEEIVSKGDVSFTESQNKLTNRSVGDPFDPRAWEALRNGKSVDPKSLPPASETKGDPGQKTDTKVAADLGKEVEKAAEAAQPSPTVDAPDKTQVGKPEARKATEEEILEFENELKRVVDQHKSEIDVSVVVRRTSEGLLIMLGDNSGKGMFGIGSARPGVGLIEIVGVIGKILAEQTGDVVIRGHTDGRKYKNGRYDNWQLSTARAHMASYMLVRGGLEEERIRRIEGYGSAAPVNSIDLFADSNRRVEFLLSAQSKAP